eukprot:3436994-Rhodomonas_salina.3
MIVSDSELSVKPTVTVTGTGPGPGAGAGNLKSAKIILVVCHSSAGQAPAGGALASLSSELSEVENRSFHVT